MGLKKIFLSGQMLGPQVIYVNYEKQKLTLNWSVDPSYLLLLTITDYYTSSVLLTLQIF